VLIAPAPLERQVALVAEAEIDPPGIACALLVAIDGVVRTGSSRRHGWGGQRIKIG